jgi:hypothetical protein
MLLTTVRCDEITAQFHVLIETDARGHYTIGKEMVDSVIDRIRRVAGKILAHTLVSQANGNR